MRLILFRERPLSRALAEFSAQYHPERNHQGKGNQLLLPEPGHIPQQRDRSVECRQEVYSSTMAASHELFDLAGSRRLLFYFQPPRTVLSGPER